MSDLPRGWAATTLGTVAPLFGGSTPKGVLTAPPGTIPFYKVSDMNVSDGHLMADARVTIPEELAVALSLRIYPAGSVIFPKVGGALYTNKKRVLTRPAAFDTNTMAAVPTSAIDDRLLYYWLCSIKLSDYAYGSPVPQLSRSRLSDERMLLPPLPEQRRIVAAVEEQVSRLDAGAAALDRARRNIKRMHNAVLEAAIKGRLLETTFATDGIGGDGWLELPLDWSIAPLGDVAEVSGGITKNPKRSPKDNAIPFLRVANVMRDRLNLGEVHNIEVFAGELERLRLRRGDLLVVEGNGSPDQIGRSALWDGSIDPCVHQNHLIRVRPGDQILPQYLNIFWNAPSSMTTIQAAASSTSGLHTLSTGKVRRIKVVIPPIRVQHQIVEEVERQVSALNALDHHLRIADTRGHVLRSAVLAAAFSGKLVPQDPADEPADLLLDRIATERASADGNNRARTRKPRTLREKVTT